MFTVRHTSDNEIFEVFSSEAEESLPGTLKVLPKLGTNTSGSPWKRTWLSKKSPWAAFIPREKEKAYPSVPMFARLFENTEVTRQRLPDGTWGWKMSDETIEGWRRLEECLRHAAERMLYAGNQSEHMDFEWPSPPSSYGFTRGHRTVEVGEACKRRSREAFLTLLAAASFCIARMIGVETVEGVGDTFTHIPQWKLCLWRDDAHDRIAAEYIDQLGETWMTKYKDVERVGCFIDAAGGECRTRSVWAVVNSEIPVWMWWGTNKNHPMRPVVPKFLLRLMPSSEEVEQAKQRALKEKEPTEAWIAPPLFPVDWVKAGKFEYKTRAELASWRGTAKESAMEIARKGEHKMILESRRLAEEAALENEENEKKRVRLVAPIFDDIEAREGEDWMAFLERKAKQQEAQKEREDDRSRQARSSRERDAASQRVPGRQGAHVFQWIENEAGRLVRTRVHRREVEDAWPLYAATQRIYNGFDNEWDLCTEFHEPGVPEIDEDDGDYDDSTFPGEERNATVEGGHAHSESIYDEDLRKTYALRKTSTHPEIVFKEDLKSVLRSRYGYWETRGDLDFPDFLGPKLSFDKARKILLEEKSRTDSEGTSVSLFVAFLSHRDKGSDEAKVSVPGRFWDLDPSNVSHRYLHWNRRSDLILTRKTLRREAVVHGEGVEVETDLWFIEDRSRTESWILAVELASSVVQILRNEMWGSTRWDWANQLLERGMAFQTLGTTGRKPYNGKSKTLAMGWRPHNFIPKMAIDYVAYVAKRDDFLSGPRGRAALLRGGIVWRLAKDVVKRSTVVVGPCRPEYEAPKLVFKGRSDGRFMYDDDLTEEETDLICGVYRVHTGKLNCGIVVNGGRMATELLLQAKKKVTA